MTTSFKAIRNTDLPHSFRQIRLELAREPGHPEGDHGIAYVMVAPLDDAGHIDTQLWHSHREACRVARLRPGAEDERGHLVHRPGGSWAFTYDVAARVPTSPDTTLPMSVSFRVSTCRSGKPTASTRFA